MARRASGWTCRKASCKLRNPPRTRKCQGCGTARPVKKIPEHKRVLYELTYEDFILINGGEHCGICDRVRKPGERRFDRDHDHATGKARGLLCHRHNRLLTDDWTPALLRAAALYLERPQ